MRKLLSALLAVAALAFVPPALARDITADENDALVQVVTDFQAASSKADTVGIIAIMPPRLVQYLADSNGLTVDQLRAAITDQIDQAFKSVTMESFGMDVAGAEHHELADGTPYLIIPTTTVMKMGEQGTVTANTPTLAFMDEGKWYLMRMDESQRGVLVGAYPQFAELEFPKASTETQSQ